MSHSVKGPGYSPFSHPRRGVLGGASIFVGEFLFRTKPITKESPRPLAIRILLIFLARNGEDELPEAADAPHERGTAEPAGSMLWIGPLSILITRYYRKYFSASCAETTAKIATHCRVQLNSEFPSLRELLWS